MLTTRQYEQQHNTSLPNVYFHDRRNYRTNSITFIWFGISPTGRRSKHVHQYRIYQGNKYPTLESALAAAHKGHPLEYGYKLPKGYKWGECLIQHDFWLNPQPVSLFGETVVLWQEGNRTLLYSKYNC